MISSCYRTQHVTGRVHVNSGHLIEHMMRPVSDAPSEEVLDRDTFLTEFKTEAYLQDFYAKVEDPAMQMVLTCLPNIVARIGEVERVLDFGAGPTIHVAASFRNQAAEVRQ
ncbi:hypothetical protein TELCIR_02773 [Teladorsagia circumcincta]|uniref:NNMT/PNMT/TEMT family protein n=1 Tax=Teladorsagia circumcincta TaxID=45464 RepID=A0A2G9UY66_TELCI|nr:hypothetical protein TELCIR_02773 [Teladorsagia circumcincta]